MVAIGAGGVRVADAKACADEHIFPGAARLVVTGDVTQIDLPPERSSGLVDAVRVLASVEGIETMRPAAYRRITLFQERAVRCGYPVLT